MDTYDSSVDGLLQLFLGDHNAIVVTERGLGGIRLRGGLKYATRTNAHQYRLWTDRVRTHLGWFLLRDRLRGLRGIEV